jgi:hypothetical protein
VPQGNPFVVGPFERQRPLAVDVLACGDDLADAVGMLRRGVEHKDEVEVWEIDELLLTLRYCGDVVLLRGSLRGLATTRVDGGAVVEHRCVNDQTGKRFTAFVCARCLELGRETKVTCRSFTQVAVIASGVPTISEEPLP